VPHPIGEPISDRWTAGRLSADRRRCPNMTALAQTEGLVTDEQ